MSNAAESYARHVSGLWTTLKRDACSVAGGVAELEPMLDVTFKSGGRAVGCIDGPDALAEAIATFVDEKGEPALAIAFCSEAYLRVVRADQVAGYRRGMAAAEFHSGDMAVREVLIVAAVHRLGDGCVNIHTPFTYDDAGHPKFQRAELTRSNLGRVADALLAAIA